MMFHLETILNNLTINNQRPNSYKVFWRERERESLSQSQGQPMELCSIRSELTIGYYCANIVVV